MKNCPSCGFALTQSKTLKEKVLNWIATGEVGASSKCMALTAVGLRTRTDYPLDGGDFLRCLKLVEAIPEIKNSFPRIAALSEYWKVIIEHWDELEQLYISDKTQYHAKTYERMKELLNPIMDRDRNVVRLGENLVFVRGE